MLPPLVFALVMAVFSAATSLQGTRVGSCGLRQGVSRGQKRQAQAETGGDGEGYASERVSHAASLRVAGGREVRGLVTPGRRAAFARGRHGPTL